MQTPVTNNATHTNWSNIVDKISKYFTVSEATYLNSWKLYHVPSEQERINIIKTAEVMDKIREFLGVPIKVHCWIRPSKVNCDPAFKNLLNKIPADTASKKRAADRLDYNAYVGGATSSSHITGLAVDFSCKLHCDLVRAKLLPKLEEFGIRMEDLPGASWVHIDLAPVKTARFFKP